MNQTNQNQNQNKSKGSNYYFRKCFWTKKPSKIGNKRVPENLNCNSSVQITVQRKVDVYVVDLGKY